MTNIFNKKVLVNNGTLINNWYEEEALKRITGITRTIPGEHIKKTKIDNELILNSSKSIDNTKIRTMGEEDRLKDKAFHTTNSIYGDFKSSSEHEFNKIGVKEKIFKDFFTSYMTNEKAERMDYEKNKSMSRLNMSTYKTMFIDQSNTEYTNKIGSRHMYTQDLIGIDSFNLDRHFMASHEMSKFKRVVSDEKIRKYLERYVPYYKDKEITFWSMNIDDKNKSNVYKSCSKGVNSFGKTSGMTEILGKSRSVLQYYGNIVLSQGRVDEEVSEEDKKLMEDFYNQQMKRVEDLSTQIRSKFLSKFHKIGWMGIRKYRKFLGNTSMTRRKEKSLIEKNDFKYLSINFGIYLTDNEIDFIYNLLDSNRKGRICFNQMIDFLIKQENIDTLMLIDRFYLYIKSKSDSKKSNIKFKSSFQSCNQDLNEENILFSQMETLFDVNSHPETSLFKTCSEVKFDFSSFWNEEKEEDLISKAGFFKYFDDVSQSVESMEIFRKVLFCFGFKDEEGV